ncbi:flagellar protein FlgN [Halobacillus sp. ACCC02827]|uniref:flagellar protein FlgN n=1 Tax=Bacillaceae TaxID=186817 RepID=UPI0002A4D555|nr:MULTISPECIES: flagellar protein FlgN [Bacillaceae]ELK47059.1 hypothetical protein D479_08011 [Halobacillus sp. BAB-2008]QHT47680.1 flagellar protein FlgN [Bacillus sp. SB49]WJE14920.1 flagellar protein FlgN [Halobacillus sp. ACCC02827]
MTVNAIVEEMGRLQQLHESLLALSTQKTSALKSNDTKAIQQLLTKERKHIQAIEKIEKERRTAVDSWLHKTGMNMDNPTVSAICECLEGQDKQMLEGAYESLLHVLADLKSQEELNAELTKQSLQFVSLSLDLLQPSIQSMNYAQNENPGDSGAPKRSLFDSKA